MHQVSIAHNAVKGKLVGADRQAKLIVRQALSYLVDGAEFSNAFKSNGWDGRSSFFDFATETFPAGFVYLAFAELRKHGYKAALVRKPFPAPLGPEHPVVDAFGEDPRYSYQPDVTRRLLKHGQIIARVATGGGKSRIAKIAYARIGRPTLFLTTRSILMYQMKTDVEAMGERVSVIGDANVWPTAFNRFTVGTVQTLSQAIELQDAETEVLRFIKNRDAAEDRLVVEFVKHSKKVGKSIEELPALVSTYRYTLQGARKNEAEILAKIQSAVTEHNQHRLKVVEFLRGIEFVILEEAHEAAGDGFYRVLSACTAAHYRLALTATPFMKDSQEANMRLMACSGPVAITVTEKELIERGVLAKPYFKVISLKLMPAYTDKNGRMQKLYRSTPWPKCYEIGVVNNAERNTHIVNEARRAVHYGLSVMILVTHRAHGALLQSMLTEQGMIANYIFGDHEQDERQAALNALKAGRIQVLIGSTILDVGVDVPAVGMVILAGAGKAEVAMRQRIGRGLRAKKAGPNVALVVDFDDGLNSTLRDHARDRRLIVDATPGFAENVVRGDFDYPALGFVRKAA